jgi:hypothetical protein
MKEGKILMQYIIALIIINTAIAYIYAYHLKKCEKPYFISAFVIAEAIPLFGVIIIYSAVSIIKGKSCDSTRINFDVDYESNSEFDICDDSKLDSTNIVSISDALLLKDINLKRKILFYSFKGNWTFLYPFLLRALKDNDTEVVHYASAIITDYRRKIYEKFEKAKEKFLLDSSDNNIVKEYINAFYDLICFEKLNEDDVKLKRLDFEKGLQLYFLQNKYIEKIYYIRKIKNEIALEEFESAYDTCMSFISEYPKSDDPYLALLELYYYSKQELQFKDILLHIKNKEIPLSCESSDIACFWENQLINRRGIK